MKFDVLARQVSAEAIDDGAWMHCNAPGTNTPLYRDYDKDEPKEAVRVRVRSIRSDVYQQHEAAEQRKVFNAAKGKSGADRDAAIALFVKSRRARDFAVLVTGFEHVSTSQDGTVV